MNKSQLVATYAIKCAKEKGTPAYMELTAKQCWDAVMLCALRSGGISASTYDALGKIYANSYATFIGKSDPIVDSGITMRKVPAGSFLGFIGLDTGLLIHAMVATGFGSAAGTKNDCIGIGSMVGWELLDLAGQLKWNEPAKCFEAIVGKRHDGRPQIRKIELRYRTLKTA